MKKFLAFALIAIIAVSGVFAQGAHEQAASGKTQITWWVFPTFGQPAGAAVGTYEQGIVDAFQAANPGIEVKVETIDFTSGPNKITAAIEGGTAPDVLFDAPGRIIEYGKNGKLVSLNDLFTKEFKSDVGNDAILGACSDGTTYWMFPISTSPFYMVINKEAWEEVGALKYVNLAGDRTWSTDDFVKALECFKGTKYVAGSVFCNGQGGDQGTRALVSNLYGATIATPDLTKYTMNSLEGIKGLTLLKKYIDLGVLDDGTTVNGGGANELFINQSVASSFCWGTSANLNNKTDKFTLESLPFPSVNGEPKLEYLVNGFCVFDNGNAAKAEAAKKLISFICADPKNVIQTGAFPVKKSDGNLYKGNQYMELIAQWPQYYAVYYNTMDAFANMRTEWWNMLQAVFTGQKTVEKGLADYDKNANGAL